MIRRATAVWHGDGMEGKGFLKSQSGVLNETPYSFLTRFKNEDGLFGTNPEELIAAAHAGCFAMALSFQLNAAGFTAKELRTDASVSMELVDGHYEIDVIRLRVSGIVPGIDEPKFLELAEIAKENCPISLALKAVKITLFAELIEE